MKKTFIIIAIIAAICLLLIGKAAIPFILGIAAGAIGTVYGPICWSWLQERFRK